KIPAELRETMVTQTPQDVVYFLGLNKLDMARPQPDVARSWFERYVKRFGSFQLRSTDVLNWAAFCSTLRSQSAKEEAGPGRRMWSLFDAATRKTIEELAAAFDAAAARRAPADVSEEKLDVVLKALNDSLDKTEFYDAKDFAETSQSAELKRLLAQKPADLEPVELRRRNLMLLQSSYPGVFVRNKGIWLPSVVRSLAVCLKLEGKNAEAVDYLRQPHPELSAVERFHLRALAQDWERDPDAP
ncbi:MAG: hypothetical protein ACRC1K_06655, partial [Planctomycetia bacterium]